MKTSSINSVLADVLAQLEAGNDPSQLIQDYPEYESEIQDFLLFQSFVTSQNTDFLPSKSGLQKSLKSLSVVSPRELRRQLICKKIWLTFKVFTPVLAMSFLVVVSLGNISQGSTMRVAQIEAEQALQIELEKLQRDQAVFENLQQKIFTPEQSQKKSILIAQKSDYNS